MQHYFQLATFAECKMISLKPYEKNINLRYKEWRVPVSDDGYKYTIWELMSMKTEIAFEAGDGSGLACWEEFPRRL